MFGLLLARACSGAGQPHRRAAGQAVLVAAAYAFTDEFHQRYVPSRTPSLRDVAIDSAGAAIGVAAYFAVRTGAGRSRPGRED